MAQPVDNAGLKPGLAPAIRLDLVVVADARPASF
jgi:hypothetical protein